jgi:cellulose synthase (UDP-forming)
MVEAQSVHYNKGPRKEAKAGNLNSALQHLELYFPQASLILTQDADEIVDPSFLKETVGYFAKPKLAFVQTPKDAIAPEGDPFGVRDRVFYDSIQPGRNGSSAAFSCGSGVLWRISAIKSIGGFAIWNLVEDLTTSYFLHSAGYTSEYHNHVLTIGLAPDDIPGLLKQRGTWATDTWRLFLFKNPLRMPKLSLRQRLQYTELGLFYTTSSFFMPLVMLTPLLSLITRKFVPIEGSALFPWVAVTFFYYAILARGNSGDLLRMWQYWVGHCPTYQKAFWIAIRSRTKKPVYQVTRKTHQTGYYGRMIWLQLLYLFVSACVIIRAILLGDSTPLAALVTNIGILLFFMLMVSGIVQASFYGVSLPHHKLRAYMSSLRASKLAPGVEGELAPQASGSD